MRAEASYNRREGGSINAHRKPWLKCHQVDVRDTQKLLQRVKLCTAAIDALAAARAVSGELRSQSRDARRHAVLAAP